jgi:hypothetical protein
MNDAPTQILTRVVAAYPLYGEDVDATEWMQARLEEAKVLEAIADFKVLDSTTGTFGLQYVTFTVDIKVDAGNTFEDVKAIGESILNATVFDSDVQVYFAGWAE